MKKWEEQMTLSTTLKARMTDYFHLRISYPLNSQFGTSIEQRCPQKWIVLNFVFQGLCLKKLLWQYHRFNNTTTTTTGIVPGEEDCTQEGRLTWFLENKAPYERQGSSSQWQRKPQVSSYAAGFRSINPNWPSHGSGNYFFKKMKWPEHQRHQNIPETWENTLHTQSREIWGID